jgi:hypothetical protein
MSEATERWLAESRAWLGEQMEAQRVRDEAAFARFMAGLMNLREGI